MREELIFQAPEAFIHAIELTPIKPPRHGSRTNQLVVMQSRKNACSLRMRPLLVDFCVTLERHQDVLYYQTCPYRLKHFTRNIEYTPSVCAYGAKIGLIFFDIVRLTNPAREHRCAYLADWFDEMGYEFRSFPLGNDSSDGLNRQYRYLYHQSFGSQPEKVSALLLLLQCRKVMSIADMLASGSAFCDIAQVLFSGQATTDLRFPLRRSTTVQLAGPSHAH